MDVNEEKDERGLRAGKFIILGFDSMGVNRLPVIRNTTITLCCGI